MVPRVGMWFRSKHTGNRWRQILKVKDHGPDEIIPELHYYELTLRLPDGSETWDGVMLSKRRGSNQLRLSKVATREGYGLRSAGSRLRTKALKKRPTRPRRDPVRMTKQEAERNFRRHVLPDVRRLYEKDGRVDGPARREAWNNFTDYLHKAGYITRRQYDTWTHPR